MQSERASNLRVPDPDELQRSREDLGPPRPGEQSAFGSRVPFGGGLRTGERPGTAIPSGIPVTGKGRPSRGPGTEGFFGSCPSGSEGRVALQIPADGWEVPVVLRHCTFRRWPSSLPRVGGLATPGHAASSRGSALRSPGQGGRPSGCRRRPGKRPAQAAALPETHRQVAGLVPLPARRETLRGFRPWPGRMQRFRSGSAEAGTGGSDAGRTSDENERPARVSSLPSGRSAISLRFIGHARPGIRARKLIKD